MILNVINRATDPKSVASFFSKLTKEQIDFKKACIRSSSLSKVSYRFQCTAILNAFCKGLEPHIYRLSYKSLDYFLSTPCSLENYLDAYYTLFNMNSISNKMMRKIEREYLEFCEILEEYNFEKGKRISIEHTVSDNLGSY